MRKRMISKLHVGLALVRASVVRRRKHNASTDKFDNSTLAVDCSDEEVRSMSASLFQIAQDDSKRTAGNSETDYRREGFRSLVRDRGEIRSEEHVRHKFGIRNIDQQHL